MGAINIVVPTIIPLKGAYMPSLSDYTSKLEFVGLVAFFLS